MKLLTYFGFSLLGLLLFEMIMILMFSQRTKTITNWKVKLGTYFDFNNVLTIGIGIVVSFLIALLMCETGSDILPRLFTANVIDGSTPFETKLFMALVGLGFQLVVNMLSKLMGGKAIWQYNIFNPEDKNTEVQNIPNVQIIGETKQPQ